MFSDVLQSVLDPLVCVVFLCFFIHGAQLVCDSHIDDPSAPFFASPRFIVDNIARFSGVYCDSATFLFTHVSLVATRRHLHVLTVVE
jgi:hypothetical protein